MICRCAFLIDRGGFRADSAVPSQAFDFLPTRIMANRTYTSSAHTAGPWYLTNHNEIVARDFHESFIAEVFDQTDQWRANARLIAAAPELLAAAKDALTALDFAAKRDPDQAGIYHCPLLRDSIAKAEGA